MISEICSQIWYQFLQSDKVTLVMCKFYKLKPNWRLLMKDVEKALTPKLLPVLTNFYMASEWTMNQLKSMSNQLNWLNAGEGENRHLSTTMYHLLPTLRWGCQSKHFSWYIHIFYCLLDVFLTWCLCRFDGSTICWE